MMKKYCIYILLILISGSFFLTGCRWFADNPMFPTGKFEVSYKVMDERGEEAPTGILGVLSVTNITSDSEVSNSGYVNTVTTEISGTEDAAWYTITVGENGSTKITEIDIPEDIGGGSITTSTNVIGTTESYQTEIKVTFARVVEFTFSPINNVGAEIQDCEVVYTDNQGMAIDSLKKKLAVYLYIPPLGSTEVSAANASRTLKLEIFDQSIQDYYINHNIPFGQAIVTFNGLDGAGHPIALKKAISINANMIDDRLQAEIDEQIQEIIQNQGQNPGSSCSSCSF